MMYEKPHQPLIPPVQYVIRILTSIGTASIVIVGALTIGIVGYHGVAGLSWIDSLLNASMILAGMGPTSEMRTDGAKLFASGYALFSGIVFITVMGIVIAPMTHRILHKFHLEKDNDEASS